MKENDHIGDTPKKSTEPWLWEEGQKKGGGLFLNKNSLPALLYK